MKLFLNFIEAYLIYNILLISVEQQSICVCVWGALSHVWLFVTPWTVACQANIYIYIYTHTAVVVVQSLCLVWLSATPWITARQGSLDLLNSPIILAFVVVQWLSYVWLLVTTWTAALPGFLVLHNLPEWDQTHVHWVTDAIQPSHPLSPLSPALSFPATESFPMSQHFASGGQSIGLQLQQQQQSSQWIFRADFL